MKIICVWKGIPAISHLVRRITRKLKWERKILKDINWRRRKGKESFKFLIDIPFWSYSLPCNYKALDFKKPTPKWKFSLWKFKKRHNASLNIMTIENGSAYLEIFDT